MPYGRRRYSGKRRRLSRYGNRRARYSRGRPRKTRTIAYKALRIARTANQKELKHVDLTYAARFPGRQATDLFFNPFLDITQGLSDNSGRVGDSVRVKSLHLKGSIQLYTNRDRIINSVAGNMYNYYSIVRMWVALFPMPITSPNYNPNVTNLFTVNDIDFYAPFGFKEWDNRFRSRLLYQKLFVVHGYKPLVTFDVKIPLNIPVQWSNDTGDLTNNCVLYGFQSDLTYTVTYARIDHISRTTYTDS